MEKKKEYKRDSMIPQTLLRRVKAGEQRTIAEWAQTFGTNYNYVNKILGKLRKRNHMIYPVNGILKEVVKRTRDYRTTSERLSKTFLHPHFISGIRLKENYLLEDPSRRSEVELNATSFVKMVEEYTQRLLTAGK